ERHHVGPVLGIAPRAGPVVHAGGVDDAVAAGLAPLEGLVGGGRVGLARVPDGPPGDGAPRQYEAPLAGGVPERGAGLGDGWFQQLGPGLAHRFSALAAPRRAARATLALTPFGTLTPGSPLLLLRSGPLGPRSLSRPSGRSLQGLLGTEHHGAHGRQD